MKQISKSLLLSLVFFTIFTLTGCSKKQYPKAEYHLLTGRKTKPFVQGIKTANNTLPLNKKQRFTLAATDSVISYTGNNNERIYANYKVLFANVVPNKNYRVTLHTLPDTHTSTYKYLFQPFSVVLNREDTKLEITNVESKWANAFEKPGLKTTYTFNSGDNNQIAISVFADNNNLDEIIHVHMINFVKYKFITAPTGDFFITIEEITEK